MRSSVSSTRPGLGSGPDTVANGFSEGLAAVLDDQLHRFGFIDKTGAWVIQPRFQIAESFSQGLAAATEGGKWGFIDKTGAWVIQPPYDDGGAFSGGLAALTGADGTLLYIDTTGKIVWHSAEPIATTVPPPF